MAQVIHMAKNCICSFSIKSRGLFSFFAAISSPLNSNISRDYRAIAYDYQIIIIFFKKYQKNISSNQKTDEKWQF